MMNSADREQFSQVLTNTITCLCHQAIDSVSVAHIDGLLGVTLVTGEVFLIRVSEAIVDAVHVCSKPSVKKNVDIRNANSTLVQEDVKAHTNVTAKSCIPQFFTDGGESILTGAAPSRSGKHSEKACDNHTSENETATITECAHEELHSSEWLDGDQIIPDDTAPSNSPLFMKVENEDDYTGGGDNEWGETGDAVVDNSAPNIKVEYQTDDDYDEASDMGMMDCSTASSDTIEMTKSRTRKCAFSHSLQGPTDFDCKFCHCEFRTLSGLRRHVLIHHQHSYSIRKGYHPLKDEEVERALTTLRRCQGHVPKSGRLRRGRPPKNRPVSPARVKVTLFGGRQQFTCPKCQQCTVSTASGLDRHCITAHSGRFSASQGFMPLSPRAARYHQEQVRRRQGHSGQRPDNPRYIQIRRRHRQFNEQH